MAVDVMHPKVPAFTKSFPVLVCVGLQAMALSVGDVLLIVKVGATLPVVHCGVLPSGPHDPASTSSPLSVKNVHCTLSAGCRPRQ